MAYEILSESYGRRLPKIAAEADSADDLATLGTNWAEGSTCVIGDKTYSLDKVQGWVEPGSGGGGGGGVFVVKISGNIGGGFTADKTYAEILSAYESGLSCAVDFVGKGTFLTMQDENPEIFGYVLWDDGGTLYSYYIEFSESGLDVSEAAYSLTPINNNAEES